MLHECVTRVRALGRRNKHDMHILLRWNSTSGSKVTVLYNSDCLIGTRERNYTAASEFAE